MTEFVVPSGPLITLQDGRAITGHIVRIDQTDVVIQTDDGATQTLPRATVESVAFETITGRKLVGELVGWTPGVYQITTAEAAIKVYSTMPAAIIATEPAIAPDSPEQDVVEAGAPEAADAGEGSSQAIAAVAVDETANGTESGTSSAPVGSQNAAVTPTSNLSITVSVENSKENGPPVAFNIELSEPSEKSVVLIYATIDGTAINGQDYEANRGVVVIKPGEMVARIEAPVIDDTDQEEQEHLQLFLTVDPTVAVVENRQIIATIDDDDQG
ncbi:MAG: hypothetical protein OEU92_14715 [Alphaproteobacteria bacterium]|nr:hypothetical protein [Alphaproteobacteria bacterium]